MRFGPHDCGLHLRASLCHKGSSSRLLKHLHHWRSFNITCLFIPRSPHLYRIHIRTTPPWKHLSYYIVPVTFLSFFFNIPMFINLQVRQFSRTKVRCRFCLNTRSLKVLTVETNQIRRYLYASSNIKRDIKIMQVGTFYLYARFNIQKIFSYFRVPGSKIPCTLRSTFGSDW